MRFFSRPCGPSSALKALRPRPDSQRIIAVAMLQVMAAAPDRPWFLWDVDVTESAFRERLRHPDPDIRAQWQGRLLREARFEEVWQFVTLAELLENWPRIERHLGRMRGFWEFLLRGWREDGLIAT